MDLKHLNISVTDVERSRRFYETSLGLKVEKATRHEDGVLSLLTADGFNFALAPTEDAPLPGVFHFGFRQSDPSSVRALADRLQAESVSIVERVEEPDLVSFKCLDPDGYTVEVYWEGEPA